MPEDGSVQIKLQIKGRDASPGNVGSAVEDAILLKVKDQMMQKLSNLRCPDLNG